MNCKKLILVLFFFPVFMTLPMNLVHADKAININIKTILASEQGPVDPRLKGFINEIKPLFNYSSYELLSQNSLTIRDRTKKTVGLPGNRSLKITSKGISGKRVTLQLEIYKKNNRIFQTIIQLRNKSSITIGGPKHKRGNLLFNIFASF